MLRPVLPPFTLHELIFERGNDPATRDEVAARMGAQTLTYAELSLGSIRWAHLFRARRSDETRTPRVAVMMQNNLEFLLAYGGAAFSGGTLFAINTGLSGEVLRKVIEASGADTLVVDAANRDAINAALGAHPNLIDVGRGVELPNDTDPPDVPGIDPSTPLAVVYTSGTTGLPKGVINSHGKLRGIGVAISMRCGIGADDVGYVSMPLFHSNSVFLNWLPAMQVGASVVLRDRFSASGFWDDVREYGATYWNYVGQPVHYVLEALAKRHADPREVREDPRNRLRIALGTGASGSERRRFVEWLGLEHVYEMYGSTEAEISSWCMPGDPIDSVGAIEDSEIAIVDEAGRECAPLELDERGGFVNRASAVGEIVRRGTVGLFQGYHGMPDASAKKVEGGLYRSGDLGAIRVVGERRYLYFFGRTDDWIRTDGENFSAEAVVKVCESAPGVDRAAAFGAPHPVSDEWVMVAVAMKTGESFDPQRFFDHCVANAADPKWVPTFVRVVDAFEWTETLKIKVRVLKAAFYHPDRADRVFFRERGDRSYRPFSRADFGSLSAEFEKSGRAHLVAID